MKAKQFFSRIKSRLFFFGLDTAARRATKLYKKQGNTVVCVYCGRLLKKEQAGMVYDIGKNEAEYHHEACFEKYAPHGTLDDLERAAKEG